MLMPPHEGEITYTPKKSSLFIHSVNALICIKHRMTFIKIYLLWFPTIACKLHQQLRHIFSAETHEAAQAEIQHINQ